MKLLSMMLVALVALCGGTLTANAQCASGYTQSPDFACQINPPIAASNLTFAANLSNAASYTTASISPGANKLVLVSVETTSTGTPNAPTVTGAGGTWVQVGTAIDATNARRVTVLRDLSASPGSGPLTIDFAGQTQTSNGYSVDQFSNVDTSGTHGSGAIVQSVTGSTTSGTTTGFTVNLAALGSSTNAAFGAIRNNGTALVSPGSGFTELSNQGINRDSEWALNQTAVSWTWPSQASTVSVALAAEIKAQSSAQCAGGFTAIQVCKLNVPVITSPLTLTCDLHGDPCNYQITASTAASAPIVSYYGADPAGHAFPDLVFDTSTGAMTGTVRTGYFTPGTYSLLVGATNAAGLSDLFADGILTLTVVP